jgi:hypothetical protein
LTPAAIARRLPSPVRSRISSRSNSAMAASIVTSKRPCELVVVARPSLPRQHQHHRKAIAMTKRAMTKRQCTRLLILAIRKEKRSRRHMCRVRRRRRPASSSSSPRRRLEMTLVLYHRATIQRATAVLQNEGRPRKIHDRSGMVWRMAVASAARQQRRRMGRRTYPSHARLRRK